MYSTIYPKVLSWLEIGRATMFVLFSITRGVWEDIDTICFLKSFWRVIVGYYPNSWKEQKECWIRKQKVVLSCTTGRFRVPWHITREAWVFIIPAAPNVYFYPYSTSISTLNWMTVACLNHDITVFRLFYIVIAIVHAHHRHWLPHGNPASGDVTGMSQFSTTQQQTKKIQWQK